jgi:carboxylesterase
MENKILPGCEPAYMPGNETGCLLLHGFTSSPHDMHLLGKFLNEKGYTVHIPLLPGHGTSEKNLKSVKWYQWFEAAKNELFQLRKSCKKVFVMGFSMGGSLAVHLAAHYEVNGVVALAPGMYLKNKMARFSGTLSPFLWYSRKLSGPDVKADVDTISYKKIPLKAIHEMRILFKHLRDDLNDVYSPTLIIYSRQDHVIHPKSSKFIYNNISSKKKRILELKESYHIITLDVEKEIIFSEVDKFITQR